MSHDVSCGLSSTSCKSEDNTFLLQSPMLLSGVLRQASRGCTISRNALRSFTRAYSGRNSFFKVSEEVQEAVATGKPVVALETTIYTHGKQERQYVWFIHSLTSSGWPYPENVALASRLESLVRVNGGIPATIGVLNGVAQVGMSPENLIELTESIDRQKVWKISRRDLGFITGMVG